MKKLILYSGLAMLIFSACSKSDDDYVPPAPIDTTDSTTNPNLISQDFNYDTTFNLSTGLGFPIPIAIDTFFDFAIATNYEANLDSFNTTAAKVVDVKLKMLNLLMVTPDTADFDFVDSMSIYVLSGSTEILVANKVPFPQNQDNINLDIVPNKNLKPYFLQDTMKLRVRGQLNSIPGSGEVKMSSKFTVRANP